MEDTTISIIGIIIAAIIMFIVPLMLIADRADDISQLVVQTATSEFVNDIIKSGKITDEKYGKFVNQLASSGNTYEIDMEVKILDENTAKIFTENNNSKIRNNTYYSIYTSQIEDIIGTSGLNTENNNDGKIILKQGDAISVTVRNSSKTLSQSLKSFYYTPIGSDVQIITATASGTVAINGAR